MRYPALAMNKQQHYFKLIPPRPSFPFDHDCRRKGAMEQHSTYCKQQFDAGWILLYAR